MEELKELRREVRIRLLCCIGFVALLGILIVAYFRTVLFLPFVIMVGVILSVFLMDGPRKRYRSLYKEAFVREALASVFDELEYQPDYGIPYETIASTKMMNMGDRFHAEDYVSGRYRDIPFVQSDVHIEEEQQSTDSDGHTTTSYVTIFRGRWMIFAFNKRFKARLQVVQNGFPNAKRKRFFGRKETLFRRVEMESDRFNSGFRVFAQDEHDAFYILTPAMMERIEGLAARNRGKLLFCFIDEQLHIAIHDNRDAFEPGGIFAPLDEERVTERIRSEIRVITQFIDELSLDNDLFLQEE